MSHSASKTKVSRRTFLRDSAAVGFLFGLGIIQGNPLFGRGNKQDTERREVSDTKQRETSDGSTGASPPVREAMFYTRLSHSRVECGLCFRRCILHHGERGECRNRENRDGTLYNLVWGKPSAINIDPVEKEPQHHLFPGTPILCFGTAGCNFHCSFCQNWHLSQRSIDEMEYFYPLKPEDAVAEALNLRVPTISFTYNEPTSFYEYVYDIARIAKNNGLHILWHSNGALNAEPLKELLLYTDAVTIDLKGFRESIYRRYSQAELEPVLNSLKLIRKHKTWLEIVNLVIPTVNDDPDDVRRMCEWICLNLGSEIPLHFSRFFPAYKLTRLPPTPMDTLERCYTTAKECGLHYVALGNVPGHRFNSTYCPNCGRVLIQRIHFEVIENNIVDGKCPDCGHIIPGLWRA
jgi:pyruvate formate lyase activating enzyme